MIRRSRVGASLLALGAGIAAPSLLRPAQAQQTAWSLVWEAPADCPSEANVRDAVAQLLGTGAPPPASVSARAVVQRTSSDHWIVQLTTVREGARGERVVEATSCPSLANATALIVALTIDPERVAAHTPAPSPSASASASTTASLASAAAAAPTLAPIAPVPSASASGAPPLPPAPSSGPAPPRDHAPLTPADDSPVASRRFALLLEGVGDLGTLPHLSDGLVGGLALTFDALRLEAFGVYLFSQPAYAASLPAIGSNIDLLAGGLRGCYLTPGRVLELGACGGLEIGQLQGNGFGSLRSPYQTYTPQSGGSLWLAPVVGGRLAWRIAPYFSLVIELGVVVPIERDVFSISGASGTLHQASSVVGRGAAGPELRF